MSMRQGMVMKQISQQRDLGERLLIQLCLLRLHPILCLEVLSGVSDELRIAWMIDCFYPDDGVHDLGIVVVDVFDELRLCIGWSRYENRAGVCN